MFIQDRAAQGGKYQLTTKYSHSSHPIQGTQGTMHCHYSVLKMINTNTEKHQCGKMLIKSNLSKFTGSKIFRS